MATNGSKDRPALMLYCLQARAAQWSGVKALAQFRHYGGTVADSVFYDYWHLAGRAPEAFGLEGVEYAAKVAAWEPA